MDPRLLKYYNQELQFIREMGGEFARAYPKIAGRLALDEFECADPYVERLLEGFSLLAARIQLKLDEEFPRFTQHLLERVYPHYLSPTPSMAVMQFQPDLLEPSLAEGFRLPRQYDLRAGTPWWNGCLISRISVTRCARSTTSGRALATNFSLPSWRLTLVI